MRLAALEPDRPNQRFIVRRQVTPVVVPGQQLAGACGPQAQIKAMIMVGMMTTAGEDMLAVYNCEVSWFYKVYRI